VSGPSEAAVRAARRILLGGGSVRKALEATYDPANFEDPMDVSVRLGDVVDWLRHIDRLGEIPGAADGMPKRNPLWEAANAALCRFGGDRA
jgi:hypothetical protein